MRLEHPELRAAMKRLGLSVNALSKASGVPFSTVSSIVHARRDPGLDTARRLSAAVRVPLDKLFPFDRRAAR